MLRQANIYGSILLIDIMAQSLSQIDITIASNKNPSAQGNSLGEVLPLYGMNCATDISATEMQKWMGWVLLMNWIAGD